MLVEYVNALILTQTPKNWLKLYLKVALFVKVFIISLSVYLGPYLVIWYKKEQLHSFVVRFLEVLIRTSLLKAINSTFAFPLSNILKLLLSSSS